MLKNKLISSFFSFLAALVILSGIGCGKKDGSSNLPSNLEEFPLAFYKQNPGGLLLVQVSSSDGLVQKVPVFISEGTGPGVLPGQKFLMTVLVGADNLIIVENYEKY